MGTNAKAEKSREIHLQFNGWVDNENIVIAKVIIAFIILLDIAPSDLS